MRKPRSMTRDIMGMAVMGVAGGIGSGMVKSAGGSDTLASFPMNMAVVGGVKKTARMARRLF